jgi:hypothetical protein
MRRASIGLVGLFLACGGGASVSVHTDYDPLASPKMAAYHTWNWLRAPTGTAARPDTSVQALVEQVVETRLSAMGYQKSDTNPEFRVGWHAALGDPLEVTSVNNYYGCAWGRWFPGGGVNYSHGFQTQFEPGSLVLDVADSHARELIWRGIGRDVFSPKESASRREKIVTEAVTKLFEQFPPKGKK